MFASVQLLSNWHEQSPNKGDLDLSVAGEAGVCYTKVDLFLI
jgi:hypothetical protein